MGDLVLLTKCMSPEFSFDAMLTSDPSSLDYSFDTLLSSVGLVSPFAETEAWPVTACPPRGDGSFDDYASDSVDMVPSPPRRTVCDVASQCSLLLPAERTTFRPIPATTPTKKKGKAVRSLAALVTPIAKRAADQRVPFSTGKSGSGLIALHDLQCALSSATQAPRMRLRIENGEVKVLA